MSDNITEPINPLKESNNQPKEPLTSSGFSLIKDSASVLALYQTPYNFSPTNGHSFTDSFGGGIFKLPSSKL